MDPSMIAAINSMLLLMVLCEMAKFGVYRHLGKSRQFLLKTGVVSPASALATFFGGNKVLSLCHSCCVAGSPLAAWVSRSAAVTIPYLTAMVVYMKVSLKLVEYDNPTRNEGTQDPAVTSLGTLSKEALGKEDPTVVS